MTTADAPKSSIRELRGAAEPPDLIDPSGAIGLSFTDPHGPPGVVMRFLRPARGTIALAQWVVGPCTDAVLERFGSSDDVRLVLDMREMTGRSAAASALLVQHARRLSARIGAVVIVPSAHLGPTYLSVLESVLRVVRMAGVSVELEVNTERALERLGLQSASRPRSRARGA